MDITRKEREELNALSKEVFGVSSKWQKFFKGVNEFVVKTITEVVPGDQGAPDTTKEVIVPVLDHNGAKTIRSRRYSVEECRKLLLDAKKQRDDYIAKIVAQQVAAKNAQDLQNIQKNIQEQVSGTVKA